VSEPLAQALRMPGRTAPVDEWVVPLELAATGDAVDWIAQELRDALHGGNVTVDRRQQLTGIDGHQLVPDLAAFATTLVETIDRRRR
jgi:hypothetical protein